MDAERPADEGPEDDEIQTGPEVPAPERVEEPVQPVHPDRPGDHQGPAVRDRWLAAVAYLGPGFLLPMLRPRRGPFVRWHTQQGFVLFFFEAVLLALIVILDQTLGRIPVLGFLVMILVELAGFVTCLMLSIVGFVKALAGEEFRFPVLEEFADKIPVEE